jgi:hypothetical protein
MWKAVAVYVMTICGLGLSGLVGPEAVGADAVDNAYRLCAAMGLVKLTESRAITRHSGERAIPHVSFRQPVVCR